MCLAGNFGARRELVLSIRQFVRHRPRREVIPLQNPESEVVSYRFLSLPTYKQVISATNPDRSGWLASMAKEHRTLD